MKQRKAVLCFWIGAMVGLVITAVILKGGDVDTSANLPTFIFGLAVGSVAGLFIGSEL